MVGFSNEIQGSLKIFLSVYKDGAVIRVLKFKDCCCEYFAHTSSTVVVCQHCCLELQLRIVKSPKLNPQ